MPIEDKAYVSSLLIKDHKYEPNINTVEENGQTTDLYKVRVHFNDLHYDLCIAIGDIKKLETVDSVDYKYVYVVKYGMVVSKLGIYEFIHGGNNNEYKEGSMLLFDNFADSYKLNDLKQNKDEYIVNIVETNKESYKFLKALKTAIIKSKGETYEKKYSRAIKAIETKSNKDILLKTLKFYNELHKTTDITNINFIKDGILDNDLVGKYKADYESMTYNDFICMIFGINFELLDELDEFEEKPVSYNRQSLDKVKTLVNNSKNEVSDANEAEEANAEDNEAEEADAEDNEAEDNEAEEADAEVNESNAEANTEVNESNAEANTEVNESNAEDNESEEAAESESESEANEANEESEANEANEAAESEANEANEANEESEAEDNEVNEESEAEEDINLPPTPTPTPTPISGRSQKTPSIPSQTKNSTTDKNDNEKTNVGGKMKMKLMKRKMKL